MKTTPRQRIIRLKSARQSATSHFVLPGSPDHALLHFTEGGWGLWEAIVETSVRLGGNAVLRVASFTIGPDQAEALSARVAARTIQSARVLLDGSMSARTDDRRDVRGILAVEGVAVRLGDNHAKWALVEGCEGAALLLSSSNLSDARKNEFVQVSLVVGEEREALRRRFDLDFFAGKEWA